MGLGDIFTLPLEYIIFTFAISMLWAPFLIKFLYKRGIVRNMEKDFSLLVEERAVKHGTPIMGGLLVVITVILITLFFNFSRAILVPLFIFAISALLGGIDDIMNLFGEKRVIRTTKKQAMLAKVHKSKLKRVFYILTTPWNMYLNVWYALGSYPGKGLHAGEKIVVQIISGAVIAAWIVFHRGIQTIWLPWLGDINIGLWLFPLIVFTVISMTNAVNISDGMDGLSAGTLLAGFGAFLIIAIMQVNFPIALLNATVMGALLAYLYFNIKPARFEMGDVGSLALGALIATVALLENRLMLLPIIGAVYVAEIGSSLVQGIYRRIFGRRLIKMAPLHLHFSVIGWSEEKTVMRFWLFAVLFAVIGVWLSLQ